MFKRQHGSWTTGAGKQRTNTKDCFAFYAGDFMSYTDRLQFADGRGKKKTTLVQFNRVKPYVNSVRGFMAQNRQKADYSATHPNDDMSELYSQYMNSYKDHCRELAHANQVETQQDGDMLICGYGAVETELSYGEGFASTNPNGQMIMGRIDPEKVYWDWHSRAPNLMDARFCGYQMAYELKEALLLFDDSVPDDFEVNIVDGSGNKVYYKRGGTYNKIQELYDVQTEGGHEDMVRVWFHQWYEIENYYRAENPLQHLQDPEQKFFALTRMQEIAAEQDDPNDIYALRITDSIISCDKATRDKLIEFFDGMVPLEFERFKRKVFYKAVLSGNTVFKKYRTLCQEGFTLKFKTGDYDNSNKMWTGMVNSLRDPALYYNKGLTELLWVIASQAKGGVLVERGAVDDIADFEARWAQTDGVAIVEDGAISGNKIKPKKEGYQPTGIEELLSAASESLPEVSGIDKAFLGSSENKLQTAALHRQIIKQVTSTLATYFDSIYLYQMEWSRLVIPFFKVLAENNAESLFPTNDEDGERIYLRLSKDNMVDEYNVHLVPAPEAETQKEQMGETLQSLAGELLGNPNPQLQAAGIETLIAAINIMAIDFKDRRNIIRALRPEQGQITPQQVEAMQNQIKQLTSQAMQAKVGGMMAKQHLDMMKGAEIVSNIKLKNADRSLRSAQAKQTNVETQLLRERPISHESVEVNA
ncbi:MAG: hypothetical protein KGJ90_05145 [Patescibacteria group bacterium]|nr:hypothetical protein [Patescibacteria group bacterium]